ncbi:hypothetical protein Taro_049574 [Colocasia esculenta]|uniref:DNA/RNA-binding protein Alba-like domain-containing protein n=1 Tax=Colocasia esculenta TaxID=4460 RepID=A0A843XBB4_COLES|nr:hypothetical protein [Colocasia esculenta]
MAFQMLATTLRLILQTSRVSSFNFSIFIFFIAYVNTIVTLVEKRMREIMLKAMGQAISKTVAIAEVIKVPSSGGVGGDEHEDEHEDEDS